MTNIEIQQMLESERWPIRNGLYFPDGRVILLSVLMPWEVANESVSVTITNTVTIDEIEEIKSDYMTDCIWKNEQRYEGMNLCVSPGEGSWGSEGLVAVTQMSTGQLVWLLYLDCSNPFETALLANGVVTAVSNLGHTWRLPLAHPETLTVSVPPREMTRQ